jgi:hypothetical protein
MGWIYVESTPGVMTKIQTFMAIGSGIYVSYEQR